MRRGSGAKFYPQRIAWLQAHPDLCVGVPSLCEDVTNENRTRLDALEVAMIEAGLFGVSRAKLAVKSELRRETIRRLVGEVRDGVSITVAR